MKNTIYLDYAAATPVDPSVLAAMQPFFSDQFYNPSADYEPARLARKALDESRATVAQILGAKPAEIVFTAGATEANNLAIHGVMREYPDGNMAISAIEHDSVRAPAANYEHTVIPVDAQGLVAAASLSACIDDKTVLVSVMYANNEVGSIQPLRRIAAEIEAVRVQREKAGNTRPLYFHTDAAQAGNYLDLHVHRLGVDLLTINGGKIYGPKQSGALFVRTGLSLQPLIEGGGQERTLRSGTENVPGVVGLATALQMAAKTKDVEISRVSALRDELGAGIAKLVPKATVNGPKSRRLPNNLHVTFPGHDNERLLMALDAQGVYAAAGSACSASSDEPSRVLAAMGLSKPDIYSSLRFSLGRQTTEAEIKSVLATLASVLAQ